MNGEASPDIKVWQVDFKTFKSFVVYSSLHVKSGCVVGTRSFSGITKLGNVAKMPLPHGNLK